MWFLHCCFRLWGKLVKYPRLLIISPRSLSNFWNSPQCTNRCCTGHTTTSTEREKDRLITAYTPFLAITPHQNATQVVRCTMDPQCEGNCYRLCGFVFWIRKGNKILLGNSQKCLRQWLIWNFWRAINAQCVTHVGTVSFGKTPWRTTPWIFHLWSMTQGFHTRRNAPLHLVLISAFLVFFSCLYALFFSKRCIN